MTNLNDIPKLCIQHNKCDGCRTAKVGRNLFRCSFLYCILFFRQIISWEWYCTISTLNIIFLVV